VRARDEGKRVIRVAVSSYLALLRQNAQPLGLSLAVSSFEQTSFVSLFGAEIRREFSLSDAGGSRKALNSPAPGGFRGQHLARARLPWFPRHRCESAERPFEDGSQRYRMPLKLSMAYSSPAERIAHAATPARQVAAHLCYARAVPSRIAVAVEGLE
jgi:hypothetical protein